MIMESKDVATLESALMRYALATDSELLEMRGSVARIAITLHGSEENKLLVKGFNQAIVNKMIAAKGPSRIPERAPRSVLRPHSTAGPGAIAEIPANFIDMGTSELEKLF